MFNETSEFFCISVKSKIFLLNITQMIGEIHQNYRLNFVIFWALSNGKK
jgi:hypothetical protein